jgi:hypothetical protein
MAEYTKELIAKLKEEIKKAPKKVKPRSGKLTKSAVIKSLEPQIRAMQKKGYLLGEISEFLTSKGLQISKATLTAYLNTDGKAANENDARESVGVAKQ